jgi:hypothetical protein
MNIFRYVVGQSGDFARALDEWASKAEEYIYLYFNKNRENVRNTSFGDCIIKTQLLSNVLVGLEQGFTVDDFRGVQDERGIIQAIATIKDVDLYDEGVKFPAISLESICNAPWNLIPQVQIETRKGGPTSLIEEITKESKLKQFGGVIKLFTVPRARPRYAKIGFIDTDGSGEMLLIRTNSEVFLARQQQLRNLQTFD